MKPRSLLIVITTMVLTTFLSTTTVRAIVQNNIEQTYCLPNNEIEVEFPKELTIKAVKTGVENKFVGEFEINWREYKPCLTDTMEDSSRREYLPEDKLTVKSVNFSKCSDKELADCRVERDDLGTFTKSPAKFKLEGLGCYQIKAQAKYAEREDESGNPTTDVEYVKVCLINQSEASNTFQDSFSFKIILLSVVLAGTLGGLGLIWRFKK
jgi:hypothetical protein